MRGDDPSSISLTGDDRLLLTFSDGGSEVRELDGTLIFTFEPAADETVYAGSALLSDVWIGTLPFEGGRVLAADPVPRGRCYWGPAPKRTASSTEDAGSRV